MRKKDILELKRRLKKDDCTFTRMCGCYVDGKKNIVLDFKKTFLNLEEEEFFKYLEIAKKTLSGTINNNLLELNFPSYEEEEGGKQHFLMELKKSRLKNDLLLNDFYQSIIDSYDYTGNFLIIVFHDAYDVITKTTDNLKVDESEEVYEYILCAICPVELSKAALGYFEEDNRIGSRVRDWVVGSPDIGFVFPAFIERSSDIHSIMYYTKNAKDPHRELMEDALGCGSKQTATEQKVAFNSIVRSALGGDDEASEHIFMDIQENLNNMIDEHELIHGNDSEPVILTTNAIKNVLEESRVPEEISLKIEKSLTEEFRDAPPVVEHLIDSKVLNANEQRKKEQRLKEQVQILQAKLEETEQNVIDNSADTLEVALDAEPPSEEVTSENYDIVLHVKPEKIEQIKSQIIDGKKCIIIPIENNEQANVNGVPAKL